MIAGMLTIGCLLYLIGHCGIKIWNVYHKAQKFPWGLSILLWVFSFMALAGLMIVLNTNNTLASQDEFFQADLQEAIFYVQFGVMLVGVSTMLTFAEVLMGVGYIATQGFGKPTERGERHQN